MGPFDVLEAGTDEPSRLALWLRGGFSDSLLARSDGESVLLRRNSVSREHRQAARKVSQGLRARQRYSPRNLLAAAPQGTLASFYRTVAAAEIDLVLDLPKDGRWAVEIKRSLTAKPEKGFYVACEDLKPARRFVVYCGDTRFPASPDVEAIGVRAMAQTLAKAS
jgi:hypothetical protein